MKRNRTASRGLVRTQDAPRQDAQDTWCSSTPCGSPSRKQLFFLTRQFYVIFLLGRSRQAARFAADDQRQTREAMSFEARLHMLEMAGLG